MMLATGKCLIDEVYYSQIDYSEREEAVMALSDAQKRANEKYKASDKG